MNNLSQVAESLRILPANNTNFGVFIRVLFGVSGHVFGGVSPSIFCTAFDYCLRAEFWLGHMGQTGPKARIRSFTADIRSQPACRAWDPMGPSVPAIPMR